MPLDSTSTLSDVKNAYYDNADYDVNNNVTQAQQFLVACRQLLLRLSKRASVAARAEEVEIDPGVLERQIIECKRWLAIAMRANTGGNVNVFSRGDQFRPTYPGPYYG